MSTINSGDSADRRTEGSLHRDGSASQREQIVNECLAWAHSGEWNCGPRTANAIRVLAMEVQRLRLVEKRYEELATAIETKWRLNQRTPNI